MGGPEKLEKTKKIKVLDQHQNDFDKLKADIREAIKDDETTFVLQRENLAKEISDSKMPENAGLNVFTAKHERNSEQTQEFLDDFFKLPGAKIQIRPIIDGAGRSLTNFNFPQNLNSPLLVNGNANHVIFTYSAEIPESLYEEIANDRKSQIKEWVEGIDNADKYGNFICSPVEATGRGVSPDMIKVDISVDVLVRGKFLDDEGEENEYFPLSIDFSDLNLPGFPKIDIKGLLWVKGEKPIFSTAGTLEDFPEANYRIYGNLADKKLMDGLHESEYIREVARGAAKAETLLGLQPGGALKNIMIPEPKKNRIYYSPAYYRPQDTETIYIEPESLSVNPIGGQINGFHETMHLLDYKYEIAREGAFADWYAELRGEDWLYDKAMEIEDEEPGSMYLEDMRKENEEFFYALNEENFLFSLKYKNPSSDKAYSVPLNFGGHSIDSAAEFFVSFLNTFNHPNFGWALRLEGPEFGEIYHKTLYVLEAQLKEVGIDENAPIFEKIEERKRIIENSRDNYEVFSEDY